MGGNPTFGLTLWLLAAPHGMDPARQPLFSTHIEVKSYWRNTAQRKRHLLPEIGSDYVRMKTHYKVNSLVSKELAQVTVCIQALLIVEFAKSSVD